MCSMEIKIGYALAKPVETQAQCDAYTAMVEAVNAHNAAWRCGRYVVEHRG